MTDTADGTADSGRMTGRVLRTLRDQLVYDRPSTATLLLGEQQGLQVFRRVSGRWGTAVGLMALLLGLALREWPVVGVHGTGTLVLGAAATALGLLLLVAGDHASQRALTAASLGSLVAMVVEVGLLGPQLEMAMVVPALGCIQALFYLRRRSSLVGCALVVVSYSVLVLTVDGYPAPGARLLVLVTVLGATSLVLTWIAGRIQTLSLRLADANAQLEARVGEQGQQIGSLQQLRQFVSPHVAQALLEHGIEALAPHRSRIAVLFCDLRGFTAFSSVAEPEEVMETLQEYYAVAGRVLQEAGATIGSFAGDGVMACFGDPVPDDDPAGTAVRTAVVLNAAMRGVVARWHRRGFEIGCGFGLAYGFATVGPVGCDGRTDYTALGPTVNLASRLCGLAQDGDVLVDGRAWQAVEGRVVSEELVLDVRGLAAPVRAHAVTAWVGDGRVLHLPRARVRPAG